MSQPLHTSFLAQSSNRDFASSVPHSQAHTQPDDESMASDNDSDQQWDGDTALDDDEAYDTFDHEINVVFDETDEDGVAETDDDALFPTIDIFTGELIWNWMADWRYGESDVDESEQYPMQLIAAIYNEDEDFDLFVRVFS